MNILETNYTKNNLEINKNAKRLEKCETAGKMRNGWKNAKRLEKCETAGKMRNGRKNAKRLEKCETAQI
jgi:hypothetical protein